MPPQVKKAKTAFLFFQGEHLAKIKQQFNCSMGDAMTEVRLLLNNLKQLTLCALPSSSQEGSWKIAQDFPCCFQRRKNANAILTRSISFAMMLF